MISLLIKHKLTLFLLLFASEFCFGQLSPNEINQCIQNIEDQYGYSFVLANGSKYTNAHSEALGSPLYLENKQLGTAIIEGQPFDSLWLAYDIFQQQMIYYFKNNFGTDQPIVFNYSKIDTIKLYNQGVFIKNSYKNINTPFLDLVFDEGIVCFLTWSKDYIMTNNVSASTATHEYGEAKKAIYIAKNGTAFRIRTNHDFLKLLKPEAIKPVKSQLKKEKIRLNKTHRLTMYQLMDYCNTNHFFEFND